MPNAGSIIGGFTDELGELGKHVVKEVVKAPKDIAGKALESLGASSSPKGQQGVAQSVTTKPEGASAVSQLDQTKDQQFKKTIARAALSEIAGVKQKQKEPTVWEKIQAETEQKKQTAKQQQQQASSQALPVMTSKRKRGDLYGMKAKKAGSEVGKNVRQD